MNTCASCKWWCEQSHAHTYGETGQKLRIGECRVKPPIMMLAPYGRDVTGEFPAVPEDAFCKEHDAC